MSRRDADEVDVAALVERAASYAVRLPYDDARRLARLGRRAATLKVDQTCQLVLVAREEALGEMSFAEALDRLERSGGVLVDAIRRLLRSPIERRKGMPALIDHAEDRGINLRPRTLYDLLHSIGQPAARRRLDDLAAILDAACRLRLDCSQARAAALLSRFDGEVAAAISELEAIRRRRDDRLAATCGIVTLPHDAVERNNALASCGCRGCQERLVAHMQPYIGVAIRSPTFAHLEREEARSQANMELIAAVDAWPGGNNFAGYFSVRFTQKVQRDYLSTAPEAREMLSLDTSLLSELDGGRGIKLEDRVPDRTVDVARIVELRDEIRSRIRERRERWEEAARAYFRSNEQPPPDDGP